MKLYTKVGDDGNTGLFGGPRVAKCDLRVCAYGEVDELNAAIGVALCGCEDAGIRDGLLVVQADLFVVGAELATAEGDRPAQTVVQAQIDQLERWIDAAGEQTPPLRNFILPGGTAGAAQLHHARAVCRRAERAVVRLSQDQEVRREVIIFLNRLGDLLFAWARLANARAGRADIPWKPRA